MRRILLPGLAFLSFYLALAWLISWICGFDYWKCLLVVTLVAHCATETAIVMERLK